MGYVAGRSTARHPFGRCRSLPAALRPRRPRNGIWSLLVPVATGCAGLMFTAAGLTAHGTQLRDDRRTELAGLIADRNADIKTSANRAARLREQVERRAAEQGGSDQGIAQQRARAQGVAQAAGLTAVRGSGLLVRLDDAPRRADGSRPSGVSADELVVHQQDVQAVVNAMWAGEADAVMIMGVRVISTSAVRCVGNTLLLDGRVYSPPFEIVAIGDPLRLQRALDGTEAVRLFRAAAATLGLGYQTRVEQDVTIPAYDGSTSLRSAKVAE